MLSDYRGDRLADSRAVLPLVLWVVLLSGGVITLGYTYLFRGQEPHGPPDHHHGADGDDDAAAPGHFDHGSSLFRQLSRDI
jgi:hypothetical protein